MYELSFLKYSRTISFAPNLSQLHFAELLQSWQIVGTLCTTVDLVKRGLNSKHFIARLMSLTNALNIRVAGVSTFAQTLVAAFVVATFAVPSTRAE